MLASGAATYPEGDIVTLCASSVVELTMRDRTAVRSIGEERT